MPTERGGADLTEDQLQHAEHLLNELEALERKLKALQDGLTRSHRLATLGTVATIIAHEFNNILTPIISYAQLALRQADAADPDLDLIRKALERALDGSTKAAQISSSMLGFARTSTDGQQATACVRGVVGEVFACVARDPKKDNITVRLDVADDLHVAMPPVSLQQVLLNLVLNARKVLKQRGGTLSITAHRIDCGDGVPPQVIIEVADNGPGIAAEIRSRLFEPFITQPADGDASEGTGLGLVVCKDLVERVGGSIGVESSPGHGATFRIALPAAP